jgi:hypothetical protein
VIVTIFWEDARQSVKPRIYGPDQLLAQCVADDLGCPFSDAKKMFEGHPKNGDSNVLTALKKDAPFILNRGPLCVVFDRDKVRELWTPKKRPTDCKAGICAAIRQRANGDYKLVLLADNMETLVKAACKALQIEVPEKRPTERDRILQRLAFEGTKDQRNDVRANVDGFNRLVKWTIDAQLSK